MFIELKIKITKNVEIFPTNPEIPQRSLRNRYGHTKYAEKEESEMSTHFEFSNQGINEFTLNWSAN